VFKMNLLETIQSGGVAVMRTDTVYGLVASALNETAVQRVFQIKNRDADKPLILLLPDARAAFAGKEIVKKYSEEASLPTTVIVNSPQAPKWLQHADSTVAYRVPLDNSLRELLRQTGPLVAPSANPQGMPPAKNILEAKDYFGNKVDLYVDGGEVSPDTKPSQIICLKDDGEIHYLRQRVV